MKVLVGAMLAALMVVSAACAEKSSQAANRHASRDQVAANNEAATPPQTGGEDEAAAPNTAAPSGDMDRADRGTRAERRAARAERRAQREARGDRGDRAGRHQKRVFAMGERVPRKFLAGRRVVTDYSRYGVQAPRGGDQWIRGRKQLLLVSADGVVKVVMPRERRRHRDRGAEAMPGDNGDNQAPDENEAPDETVH